MIKIKDTNWIPQSSELIQDILLRGYYPKPPCPGPIHPTGTQGPQGPSGANFSLLGRLQSTRQLPVQGVLGSGYLIEEYLYSYVGMGKGDVETPGDSWVNVGKLNLIKGDTGSQGTQGLTGATGASGLQGIQGLQGYQGIQGASGLQGIQGPSGDKGDQGEGLRIIGRRDSVADLPIRAIVGDGYLIDGIMYVYSGIGNGDHNTPGDAWTNCGQLAGEIGPQGVQGPKGDSASLNPSTFNRDEVTDQIDYIGLVVTDYEIDPEEKIIKVEHNLNYYPSVLFLGGESETNLQVCMVSTKYISTSELHIAYNSLPTFIKIILR